MSWREATDVTHFKDAFSDQRRLLSGSPVRTILDVGAWRGGTVSQYRELFPAATVYAFEPFPGSFAALREKFQGDRSVEPIAMAVSSRTGKERLHSNRDSATNSLLPTAADSKVWVVPPQAIETVAASEVAATSIDDFCKAKGIDEVSILKMDIQGGELHALEGATDALRRQSIRLIYTEVLFVPLYDGQTYFYAIADLLSGYGYRLFDFYNLLRAPNGQLKWGDAIFVGPDVRSSPSFFEASEGPALQEERMRVPAASALRRLLSRLRRH